MARLDNSPGAFTPNPAIHRSDGVSQIELGVGVITLIDTVDYPKVQGYRWHVNRANGGAYVCANSKEGEHTTIRLHRLITDAKRGSIVDHIDGDTLDNRKSNLRICGYQGNARNRKTPGSSTTGFKGVTLRPDGRYQARITANGRRLSLGYFRDPEDAAHAYNIAAVEYYGEYARTNQL